MSQEDVSQPNLNSSLLFSEEEDLITIETHYRMSKKKNGSKRVSILTKKEYQDAIVKKDPNVDCLITKWKPITWGLDRQLRKNAVKYSNISGKEEFDNNKYNEQLLSYALVEWNIPNVPVSPDNIDRVPSNIIWEAMRKYFDTFGEDEEVDEEGNPKGKA